MVKKQESTSKATLRFAALRRVSTEGQISDRHVSLEVQTKQIEDAVQSLGGRIAGWYGGQEHATPGYEKKEIDRLIADAGKRRFDGVVVAHADRWSRDNEKSKQGLDVFRENEIRFFVLEQEHDLRNPDAKLFLSLSAIIGEYQAAVTKKKSILSRIRQAEKGGPGNGCLPYGRNWDREKREWSIDPDKRERVQTIADRYLRGESLKKLAAEYRMNYSNLYMILVEGAGDVWRQTFHPQKISEQDKGTPLVVMTKIPRLLSAETMKAIKARMAANKTYSHGHFKNKYLLSRMVFCGDCGGALSGYMTWKGHRYYRHLLTQQGTKCRRSGRLVRADELEEVALIHLYSTFGNPLAVRRAIEVASGDVEKVQEHERRLAHVVSELEKIDRSRGRILDLIDKDTITQTQAETKLKDLRDRESQLKEEQSRLADFLGNRPSREQIEQAATKAAASIHRGKQFTRMSYEDKRALVEAVFGGKTPDGRRLGVYIRWSDDGKDWTFSIYGKICDWEDYHRLSEKKRAFMREVLDADGPSSQRGQREIMKVVSSFADSCVAG